MVWVAAYFLFTWLLQSVRLVKESYTPNRTIEMDTTFRLERRKGFLSLKNIIFSSLLIILTIAFSPNSIAQCSIGSINSVREAALDLYKGGTPDAAEALLSEHYKAECHFYAMSKQPDDILNRGLWLISDLMFYRNSIGDYLGCLALEDEVYSSWMVSEPNRHSDRVGSALQNNISTCRDNLEIQFPVPNACPIEGYQHLVHVPDSWATQHSLYYEVACIGFKLNTPMLTVFSERDGPKRHSEGMNAVPSLEILYVSEVVESQAQDIHSNQTTLIPKYQLDLIYFRTEQGLLWQDSNCYSMELSLGEQVGMLLLSGSSSPCGGGCALFKNRMIALLDYPFGATVLHDQTHTVR